MSLRGIDGAGDLALDGGRRDATTPSELSANQSGASGAEAQQQGKTHARFKKEQALRAGLVPRPAGRARAGCEWDAQRGKWVSKASGESVAPASVEAGKSHLSNAAALSDVAADAQQLQPPRHNTYRTAGQLAWNTAQDQWIEGLITLRDRAGALSGGYSDTVRLKLPHTTVERSLAWKNALKIHARMCMASDANFRANEVARKREEGRAKRQRQHEEAKASVPSEVVAAVHRSSPRPPPRSSEERKVCYTSPDGTVMSFEGPKGQERHVSTKWACGIVEHFEGEMGQERLVRSSSSSGHVYIY